MSDAVDERHADEAGTDDNPAIKETGSLNHLKPFTKSRTIERGKGPTRPTFRSYLQKFWPCLSMQRQFEARNTKNQVLGQVNMKVKDMCGKHEPAFGGFGKIFCVAWEL
jgi:hypothetical protein